jgi:HK97 family phage portal protein
MPAPALISRVAASLFPAAFSNAMGGWLWPSQANPGWWGNGDRGALGSWQMNRNGPQGSLDMMAFSAVYACVNTIASDVAKLPMLVNRVDQDNGARELQRGDYYATLFRTPNEYQTHTDFMYGFVQSFLLQGNAYAYCKRNGRGEISEMHNLNPYKVKPLIDADTGSIFYECAEDYLAGLVPNSVVPERDIIHHRLPLVPGYPLVGVTPIFAAAASSAVGIQILRDSQQFFANSARPSGILQSTINLGDDQKRKAKEEWDIAYRGKEYGKVAILPTGLTWSPITITAQDAQLIEQLRYSVESRARSGCRMLGDMTSDHRTASVMRNYLQGCLSSHRVLGRAV